MASELRSSTIVSVLEHAVYDVRYDMSLTFRCFHVLPIGLAWLCIGQRAH